MRLNSYRLSVCWSFDGAVIVTGVNVHCRCNGSQRSNLGSGNFILHSLSCTTPQCTALINQETVATLHHLAYLTFSIVCPSQQSQWVKPLNDSPGRPLVPMAAPGAGSGPGGKMIGRKNQCRSAQTRHLLKKNLSDLSLELIHHFPGWCSWPRAGSWFKRAHERKVRRTSQQWWQWLVVERKNWFFSKSFNKYYWLLSLFL